MTEAMQAPRVAEPLLSVEDLAVDFETVRGTVHAVRGVSFTLAAGETLAILGESGSGKSVTADAVMGLVRSPPGRVTNGRVIFGGRDLLALSERERRAIRGREMAMIFQDPLAALNPVYPVSWQIHEAYRIHGIDIGDPRKRAIELLQQVGIPDAARRAGQYPHQFSGGQRQRISIAMAIALRPRLLVADEPTTALDVTVQARILGLLKDLQAETESGLVIITHDLGVAAHMADRVAVMQGGEIVEQGAVREVLESPRHPYTRQLLDAVPGRKAVAGHVVARDVLLRAEDVVRDFPMGRGADKLRAVDHVSFELYRGECLGVVGESGSGKSTVARMLLGLDKPSAGRFTFAGRDIGAMSSAELFAFRRKVQVVFQDPNASLNPFMSIAEIISEPWAIHRGVVPRAQWGARVRELLERVGLRAEHALRYPHQFSGGQRQRIAIARALALEPEVVVCDEAVSALDVSIQAQILSLLKRLQREHAFSCLFIAHDLGVVRELCDRVLVMQKGQLVEAAATEDLFQRPGHPYTRELLNASLDLPDRVRPVPSPAAPESPT